MPTSDLVAAGFANMRRAQERLECWPDCAIRVNEHPYYMGDADMGTSNELRCTMPDELLVKIMKREAHWNNCELACLVRFHRFGPYLPDVHTLLSFFHT